MKDNVLETASNLKEIDDENKGQTHKQVRKRASDRIIDDD
jgi:hypothetical protein